jgi:outer membrane protein OmpA-like peptidoglycan-associated protein
VRAPVLLIGLPVVVGFAACATSGTGTVAPPGSPPPAPTPAQAAPAPPPAPDARAAIGAKIYFENARAEIKPSSVPALDAIAALLAREPDRYPQLALEGHAAANERTPMRLSLARASAVRLALIQRGVDGARLFARASGATVPACPHDRDICWERERRVEFALLGPSPPSEAEPPPATPVIEPDAAANAAPGTDAELEVDADRSPTPEPSPPGDPGLLDRVAFTRGSAVLTPSALPALDLVAGFLKANPSTLAIEGHATPDERHPDELARARAGAVRAYLGACGVSVEALIVRSQGSTKPACTERSASCRALNRRVELKFSDAPP